MSIGFKNTYKTLYRYPSLVILPIFSFWTFGPSGKLSRCSSNQENRLILSIKHTWINFGLSLIVSMIIMPLVDIQRYEDDWSDWDYFLRRRKICESIGAVSFCYIVVAFYTFACFTPMPKFLKPFCCNRTINLFDAKIKLTALDPSQPDRLIDFPEQTNDIEMNSTEQSTL